MDFLMNNDFTKWFMDCVKNKYAQFNGRARRKEYWMFTLVMFLLMIVAQILDSIIGLPVFYLLVALGLLCPSFAAGARRLHDIGKSGWFLLLGAVPLANFYLLYLLVQDSQPGNNQYGPNPKEKGVDIAPYSEGVS